MISRTAYSVISVTTPAPTLRPPARIASLAAPSVTHAVTTLLLLEIYLVLLPLPSPAPDLPQPPLAPPHHHLPPPRAPQVVLDLHEERRVDRRHRRRNVAVHRRQQLPHAPARHRLLRPLHRPQRRPPHHRIRVPRKLLL